MTLLPGERLAVYPGTFDPITHGHLDILSRALNLFDRVVLAVAPNERKRPLFSVEERHALAKEVIGDGGGKVQVAILQGLTVEFVRSLGGRAIIRGLRAVSDYEFEFQLALMNRRLAPDIESIFLMPKDSLIYMSSSLVKEIARLGGPISDFVPPAVERALVAKFKAATGAP